MSSGDYTSAETLFPKVASTDSGNPRHSTEQGEKSTSDGKVTDSTKQKGQTASREFNSSITTIYTHKNRRETSTSYLEITRKDFSLTTEDIGVRSKTDITERSTSSPDEPAIHDTYTKEGLNHWSATTSRKLIGTNVITYSTVHPTTDINYNSDGFSKSSATDPAESGDVLISTPSLKEAATYSNSTLYDYRDSNTSKLTTSIPPTMSTLRESNISSSTGTEKYENRNVTCVSKPLCHCSLVIFNYSKEHLAKSLAVIHRLRMDTRQTSTFKRTKISITDNRPSAVGVGMVGIAFIVLVVMLVVVPDFIQLVMYLREVSRTKFIERKANKRSEQKAPKCPV